MTKTFLSPGMLEGVFNARQLFEEFLFSIWTLLCKEEYKVPSVCRLSKKHHNIGRTFQPCFDCVELSSNPSVYKRCQHQKENSPSVTYSKMGAVLHLIWKNVLLSDDGSLKDFEFDVGFICPLLPIGSNSSHFNNSEGRRNC